MKPPDLQLVYKKNIGFTKQQQNALKTLEIPCAGSQDNTYKAMMNMVHAVMVLTSDVSLNPEF